MLTANNVVDRCNRAARRRWDIEEYILMEKHGGYQYEHAFSLNWAAMRNWHTMMHLGHLLNTLTLQGMLFRLDRRLMALTLDLVAETTYLWIQPNPR